jgi:hypothetical protein
MEGNCWFYRYGKLSLLAEYQFNIRHIFSESYANTIGFTLSTEALTADYYCIAFDLYKFGKAVVRFKKPVEIVQYFPNLSSHALSHNLYPGDLKIKSNV